MTHLMEGLGPDYIVPATFTLYRGSACSVMPARSFDPRMTHPEITEDSGLATNHPLGALASDYHEKFDLDEELVSFEPRTVRRMGLSRLGLAAVDA